MPQITLLPPLATQKASAGWAYVPDYGPASDPSKQPILPTTSRADRAKAAYLPTSNLTQSQTNDALTARQSASLARKLADLERDSGAGGGGKEILIKNVRTAKTTATRRILGSQKTWANYIADEEASLALGSTDDQVGRGATGVEAAGGGRGRKKRPPPGQGPGRGWRRKRPPSVEPVSVEETTTSTPNAADESTMAAEEDAMDLDPTLSSEPPVPAMLLTSIQRPPSQKTIDALISAPALPWNAARAAPDYRAVTTKRVFCEICGYWGPIRCKNCGVRVCGLDCLTTHETASGGRGCGRYGQ